MLALPLFKEHKFSAVSWLTAALTVLTLLYTLLHYHSFFSWQIDNPIQPVKPIELPFLENSSAHGNYNFTVKGNLNRRLFSPVVLRIIPDDQLLQLKVNNTEVPLNAIASQALKDVTQGFKINLKPYLRTGNNTFELVIRDFGGEQGINIFAAPTDPYRVCFFLLLCLLLTSSLHLLLSKKNIPLQQQVAWGLICFGSFIQVAYIYLYNPVDHIFSDPSRHWQQGTDVLRNDLMVFTDPILYQVYIAVLGKLTLKNPDLVFFYSALLALFGKWCWYRFFRELQSSKTLALYGWAALSLLPSWTAIYAYFMQETLMLPLLGMALWATWRCRRKTCPASFLLMVVCWILAGLTRGVCIPLAAVCCTWLWWQQSHKLDKAWQSALVLTLVLAPLSYRAYQNVTLLAPHGIGHLNAIYTKSGKKQIIINAEHSGRHWTYIFSSPSMGAQPLKPLSNWQTRREGDVNIRIDMQAGQRDWQHAHTQLNFKPADYLWVTWEGFIFLFFAESWPDTNLARVYDRIGSHARWLWFPLFMLTIFGLIANRKQLRGQWLLPSLLGAWFVVRVMLPISVNEGRYRKPLEGLLVGNLLLLASVKRRNWRETLFEERQSISSQAPVSHPV